MKGSIVELTPMNLDSGKNSEEKIDLIIEAIKRISSDLEDILRELEARIVSLENE